MARDLDTILDEARHGRQAAGWADDPGLMARNEQLAATITDHLKSTYDIDLADRQSAHVIAGLVDYLVLQAHSAVQRLEGEEVASTLVSVVFMRLSTALIETLEGKHGKERQ